MDEREIQMVADVIRSGWVTQGPKVEEFERVVAAYVGAKHAVAISSCTTALHLALLAHGVGPGDEVILPSLTFIATANAVIYTGARPVFADIDPVTCNITAEGIDVAVTGRTKAILPVHQMGLPADLDAIREVAKRHRLSVIEDAACALGSSYKGKKIGASGNIACFSFHPRKIVTTGEGGMVVADDPEMAGRLRRLRHQGMSISDLDRHRAARVVTEEYGEVGFNYRMTDIQAAVGLAQMEKLDAILETRRSLAARYDTAFDSMESVRRPHVPSYARHNFQSYWIEVLPGARLTRDALMEKLLENGIATRRGIMAIHREKPYRELATRPLPATERVADNTLLIPIFPSMTDDDQARVIETIRRTLG